MDYSFKINLHGKFANAKALPNLMMKFESDVDLSIDHYVVDCKSLPGIFSLSIDKELTMTIHEKVEGEAKAIYKLMKTCGFLVRNDSNELTELEQEAYQHIINQLNLK